MQECRRPKLMRRKAETTDPCKLWPKIRSRLHLINSGVQGVGYEKGIDSGSVSRPGEPGIIS